MGAAGVVDILWDHRILTVCMRCSEEDGFKGPQNGTNICFKVFNFLPSGLLCYSPVLCLFRNCCLTSSKPLLNDPALCDI